MTSKKNDIFFDIETQGLEGLADAALTLADIEKAAAQVAANFGQPNMIFMPAGMTLHHQGWASFPQYNGTPWAYRDRLTKREHAFAKLHTFLYKFKVLKNLSEDDHEQIKNISVKRLKRAKWAANSGPKPK